MTKFRNLISRLTPEGAIRRDQKNLTFLAIFWYLVFRHFLPSTSNHSTKRRPLLQLELVGGNVIEDGEGRRGHLGRGGRRDARVAPIADVWRLLEPIQWIRFGRNLRTEFVCTKIKLFIANAIACLIAYALKFNSCVHWCEVIFFLHFLRPLMTDKNLVENFSAEM
jgi:hypothetical protein